MSNVNICCSKNKKNNKLKVHWNIAKYWGEFSKKWAISDEKINNEDYSAKYYARQAYNSVLDVDSAKESAIATIDNKKTSVLNTLDTTSAGYISTMTILKNQATESASNAHVWSEGTDAQVQALGGTHSAKEWCLYNSTVNQNDVRALEGGLNQGEIYTKGDSDSIDSRLSEIKSIAHSTYCGDQPSDASPLDPKKFTYPAGHRPNITDDGILSVKRNNYIQAGLSVLQALEQANTWEIKLKGTVPPIGAGNICILGSVLSNFNIFLGRANANDNLFLRFWVDNNGTYEEIAGYTSFINYVGKKYECTISFNGTKYLAHFILEDGTTKDIEIISSYKITTQDNSRSNNLQIGYVADYITDFVDGSYSIDLKQFSITVDGVEVFSGNKAGVDTIKPSNFTAITSGSGSPFVNPSLPFSNNGLTISEDGITGGFSANNYLKCNLNFGSGAWNLFLRFNFSSLSTLVPLLFNSNDNRLFVGTDGTVSLFFKDNTSRSMTRFSNNPLQVNTNYLLKVSYSGTEYSMEYTNLDTGVIYTDTPYTQSDKILSGTNEWSVSHDNNSRYLDGSIDLNAFKIYVDGDLVYQPCLKIPYTESKTGSKIVDSIYRPRVNDMAEQFGYAPYYTLSDTDFTLPQTEIYGNIQQTLRSSEKSGTNRKYLYSDRTQILTGTCTSGVEVALNTPFADANYVLTIPYSAKSATAFTPTATGDWFALGEGIL